MKRNKFIVSAFIATFLVGSAQVMAADQQQTRDRLNLECNDCGSLSGESEAARDRVRDHDASNDGVQAKKQHRYQYGKDHSTDRGSSVEGSRGGTGGGKGHRR